METKIELKPCPFCGGEAYIRDQSLHTYHELTVIECRNCGATLEWIQEFAVFESKNYFGQVESRVRAAVNLSPFDAWNRRVVIE